MTTHTTGGRPQGGATAPHPDHAHPPGPLLRAASWLVLGQRKLCFVLVLAVTALLGQHLPNLRVDPRIEKTFPTDDPRLADYQALRDDFGSGEDAAMCVVEFPSDVLAPAQIARIHDLTAQLEQETWVDAEKLLTLSRATFVRTDSEGELEIGPLYTPERAEGWDADAVAADLRANPAFDQRLVSRDRRLAAFYVTQAPGDESDDARAAFVAEMRAFFSPQGALGQGEVAHLEGYAIARDSVLGQILDDSWSLFPLAFGLLLLVLALLFRQLVAPLLALTVIAGSCVWTLGAMAWLDIPLNTLSACIPVMVLVASVGDVVHLLTRFQAFRAQGQARESALTAAVHHVAGPCLLTSLTTAAGFGCLGLSQVELLSEFGLPVAFGVVAAYVVTLGAVPTLLTVLPLPTSAARATRPAVQAALARFAAFPLAHPRGVIATTLILGALGLGLAPSISLDNRLSDDLDPASDLLQTRELLAQRFGGAAVLDVVVTDDDEGVLGAPLQTGLLDLTRKLRSDEYREMGVLSALSLADFLRDAFHTWNGRAPEFDRLPANTDALAQLHFLYTFSPQDPTQDLLDDTIDPSQTRIQVRLGSVYTSQLFALADKLEADAAALLPPSAKVTVTGTSYMGRLVTQSLVSEMLLSAGMAIALVGLMVCVFFRSLKLAVLGVLCSALPLLLVLGVMASGGVVLTLSTSVVFALAFGISVDDTVHMLSAYSQRKAQGDPQALRNALFETTRALVFSTLALVLGFGVMLFSNFPANRTFAWLLALTLVFALVADLLFLPALIGLWQGEATPRIEPVGVRWTPRRRGGWATRPSWGVRALPVPVRHGESGELTPGLLASWPVGLSSRAPP